MSDVEAIFFFFIFGGGVAVLSAQGLTQTLCQDLKIANDAKIIKF